MEQTVIQSLAQHLVRFRKSSSRRDEAARDVECKVVFIKIIEIDTKNENFEAEVCVECSWLDDELFKCLLVPHPEGKFLAFSLMLLLIYIYFWIFRFANRKFC